MNKEVSKVLRDRLRADGGLPFVEKYAGLVQTVERFIETEAGQTRQRFPVSTETTIGDCESFEDVLTPDSSLKGLLYFEDGGTLPKGRNGGAYFFESSLTLVCWINRAKILSNQYSEITAIAIQNIIEKLKVDQNPENVSLFSRLSVTLNRIQPQEQTIFARYTYDEAVTQFLRTPFEFFALGLQVKFAINNDCVQPLEIENNIVCY